MKSFVYELIVGVICTLLAVLVFCSFTQKAPHGAGIAVIVNKDNPVNELSASEVKLYWLRKIKKRWPEINKNIKPADRKNKCPEQETFYHKVLGMSAIDVETYFIQKQYDNAEKPQDKFNNDADIIEFVASEPGAIGFINKNSVNSSVKVVLMVE